MKKFKKVSAFMLAVVMALAMSITAFAQTAALNPADKDNATITINNAAKGETYYIYKLFDATVGEDGQIAYQCLHGMRRRRQTKRYLNFYGITMKSMKNGAINLQATMKGYLRKMTDTVITQHHYNWNCQMVFCL